MEFLDETKNYPDEIVIKIIFVGDIRIGKSLSLVRMNTNNYLEFKKLDNYIATIGF